MPFPLLALLGALGKVGAASKGAGGFLSKIGMGGSKINPMQFLGGSNDEETVGPDDGAMKRAKAKAEVLRQAYSMIPKPDMEPIQRSDQPEAFLGGEMNPGNRPTMGFSLGTNEFLRRFLQGY